MAGGIGLLLGAAGVSGGIIYGLTILASLWVTFEALQELDSESPNYTVGPVQNSKSQLLPIPVVYGNARIAGNVFYQRFHDSSKQKLYQYIGISEGPIQEISAVRINEHKPENCSGCSYTAYLDSAAATHDYRDPSGKRPYPNNLAFLALTLQAGEKVSGAPTITSLVKGKHITVGTKFGYSRNPAWIVYDFLTNTRYGLGIPTALVDKTSFTTAAAYCNEEISGAPRFTLDYVVDAQKPAVDHLEAMLSCFRGFLVCRDQIELHIDKPVTTYYKAVGLDQIVAGSFSWWQQSDEDVINRVTIEWINPADSWERTTSVFELADDIAERGVVEKGFSLLGITRKAQVQRMGAYLLDMAAGTRNFCSFNLSLQDADIEVGDVIAVTHDLPGWTNKWMRVLQLTDSGDDDTISVVCAEYVAAVYNDRAGDIVARIDTTLDDPFEVPNVTGLTITEGGYKLRDGTHVATMDVAWTADEDAAYNYEVWYKYEGGKWVHADTVLFGDTAATTLTGLKTGIKIEVKVISVSVLGTRSTGATTQKYYIAGVDDTPPDVTRFAAVQDRDRVVFSADMPTNVDFNNVEIRIGGTSWETATPFARVTHFPVLVGGIWDGTHVFRAKQMDNGKNYSETAAVATCTVSGMSDYKNIVLEQDDIESGSGGTLTGLYWGAGGTLISMDQLRYGDVPATYGDLDFATYPAFSGTPSFESPVIDTGKVGRTGVTFDFAWTVTFDALPSYFDISSRTYGDFPDDVYGSMSMPAVCEIDIRLSDDNSTWTDYQPYVPGEYSFRYIQYRLTLKYETAGGFVEITQLQQYYDVPDILISDTISVPNTGVAIDFATDYSVDFYAVPKQVTTTMGGSSSFPVVTNLTAAGMDLDCYNKDGSAVAGDVFLVVRGY